MTQERLRNVLDAYGANPDRWPAEERDAALALVARSAEARTLYTEAARLDELLDRLPLQMPSVDLTHRVLADMPSPRRSVYRGAARRRGISAGALLAVAAVLLLVLMPMRAPRSAPPLQVTYEGEYAMPMDVLLEPPGVDVSYSEPAVGCAEGELGCLPGNGTGDRESQRPAVSMVAQG